MTHTDTSATPARRSESCGGGSPACTTRRPSAEDTTLPQRLRLFYHVADCGTVCRCTLDHLAELLGDGLPTLASKRARVTRSIEHAIYAGLLTESSQLGCLRPSYRADNTITIHHSGGKQA